ncbi:hypothetical protein HF329_15090 [Chitinophaga oryzae]|uniref:TonB-dependent receptor n=1 Tax=Chitinophaga oryzae TaxID=2725414 RepID=A0AAE6ZIL5_9BACT|nr:hypothetical protein [Chitinophaga oryzae]QJB32577.1 hypothetical protein HF329_15090 [Chitinophaga oryzae]
MRKEQKTLNITGDMPTITAINLRGTAAETTGEYLPMPRTLTDSLNPFYNNSTDWQQEIFRPSRFKDANIALSAGSEQNTYHLSADYYDESGIIKGTGFKRSSLNYNGTCHPSRRWRFSSLINLSQTDLDRGNVLIGEQAGISNDYPSFLYPSASSQYYKDFAAAYEQRKNDNRVRSMLAAPQGSFGITDYLNITSRTAANYQAGRKNGFSPAALNIDKLPSAVF